MKLSVTVNKCQVPYLEMLGTYPIAGIHETVSYCQQMLGTYPIAGIHETVSYCQQMSGTIPRNVRYISYSRYT